MLGLVASAPWPFNQLRWRKWLDLDRSCGNSRFSNSGPGISCLEFHVAARSKAMQTANSCCEEAQELATLRSTLLVAAGQA